MALTYIWSILLNLNLLHHWKAVYAWERAILYLLGNFEWLFHFELRFYVSFVSYRCFQLEKSSWKVRRLRCGFLFWMSGDYLWETPKIFKFFLVMTFALSWVFRSDQAGKSFEHFFSFPWLLSEKILLVFH